MPVRASTAPRAALAAAVGLLAASAGVDAAITDPSKCKAVDAGTPGTDSALVGQPPLPPPAGERPGGGRGLLLRLRGRHAHSGLAEVTALHLKK